MHEKSLMDNLIKQVETIAKENEAEQVTKVKVWCGALSHFTEDHFKDHFDIAAKSGIAEGADLEITISDDANHPQAQHIILDEIEVNEN